MPDDVAATAGCPRCGDPWTDHGGVEEPICRDSAAVTARGEPPRCVQCRKKLPYAWRAWLCPECAKGTR